MYSSEIVSSCLLQSFYVFTFSLVQTLDHTVFMRRADGWAGAHIDSRQWNASIELFCSLQALLEL